MPDGQNKYLALIKNHAYLILGVVCILVIGTLYLVHRNRPVVGGYGLHTQTLWYCGVAVVGG